MGKASKKDVVVSNPNNGHARTVLIVVIVAIVLALVLVGVAIISKKKVEQTPASPTEDGTIAGTKEVTGYAEPDTISAGKGLWFKGGKLLSNEEIAQEMQHKAKVLEYYFDYTCNICNDFDEELNKGKQLEDLVEGGKALVVLRPTLTHALPFAAQANNLILYTAENQPEKTWKLQKLLSSYALKTYKSADFNKTPQWTTEAQNPGPIIQQIAKDAGIDYSLVPPAKNDAGSLYINLYAQQRAAGLGADPKRVGTPLFIANGRIMDMTNLGKDDKLLEKATL